MVTAAVPVGTCCARHTQGKNRARTGAFPSEAASAHRAPDKNRGLPSEAASARRAALLSGPGTRTGAFPSPASSFPLGLPAWPSCSQTMRVFSALPTMGTPLLRLCPPTWCARPQMASVGCMDVRGSRPFISVGLDSVVVDTLLGLENSRPTPPVQGHLCLSEPAPSLAMPST
ncbi:hypothetical protein TREES_T100007591 [Tupaia chinensis]|uniref:Uncharacterized protein n=1 Tax=Tupaia chinensis TaxID=246437 RepID=L9KWL3_TUPCH|nr:hypothetical protein TREES_T100007591 [Tupaia chinensis]